MPRRRNRNRKGSPELEMTVDKIKQKYNADKVLVRGEAPKKPYESIKNFKCTAELEKVLIEKFGLEDLNLAQKTVIPQIDGGLNCFYVAPPKGGKTLSYILPLCEGIMRNLQSSRKISAAPLGTKFTGSAPIAIVLTSSCNDAENIESKFVDVLQRYPAQKPFCKHMCMESIISSIPCTGGVDIIVSTMSWLAEKLRSGFKFINFRRLRYVVFDDVILSSNAAMHQITEIIMMLANYFFTPLKVMVPPQFIFSSSEWSLLMEKIFLIVTGKFGPGVMVITSPVQIVKFSQIQLHVTEVAPNFEEKMEALKEILRNEYCSERIIICCYEDELVPRIANALPSFSKVSILTALEEDTNSDLNALRQQWHDSNTKTILITSDLLIDRLQIRNATTLIHFNFFSPKLEDMPLKVKNPTNMLRFLCLWDNIREISQQDIRHKKLDSYFLLTGYEFRLGTIAKFCKKMETPLPPSLSVAALESKVGDEMPRSLCMGFACFGHCFDSNRGRCSKRHFFCHNDIPTSIIKGPAKIVMRITICYTPSCYRAQVLKVECENGVIDLRDELNRRSRILAEFYIQSSPRHIVKSVEHGEDYIAMLRLGETDQYVFRRVQIEEIMTRDSCGNAKSFRGIFFDTGNVCSSESGYIYHIYKMVARFNRKAWAPLSTLVILEGLKPHGLEPDYRKLDNADARIFTLNREFDAEVTLSLGNKIWVNEVYEMKQGIRSSSLRLKLIKAKVADFNKKHADSIRSSCSKIKYWNFHNRTSQTSPSKQKPSSAPCSDKENLSDLAIYTQSDVLYSAGRTKINDSANRVSYSWAYMISLYETDTRLQEVIVTNQWDELTFSIRQSKFSKQLKIVEEMVSMQAIKLKCEDQSRQLREAIIDKLQCCWLVGVEFNQLWKRGIIINIDHETSTAVVFLVDYGILIGKDVRNLIVLTKDFAGKLPFQALVVKITSAGIKSLESTVNMDIEDIIKQSITINCLILHKIYQKDLNIPLFCNGYQVMFYGCATSTMDKISKDCLKKRNAGEGSHSTLRDILSASESNDTMDESELDEREIEDFLQPTADSVFDELKGTMKEIKACDSKLDALKVLTNADNEDWYIAADRKIPKPRAQASTSNSSCTSSHLRLIETNSHYKRHPTVLWKETEESLILIVEVSDVSPKITVDKRELDCSCNALGNYGFRITLFAVVTSFKVESGGPTFNIKLKKRTPRIWNRVLYDDDEVLWLKKDPSAIEAEVDDDDDTVDVEDFQIRLSRIMRNSKYEANEEIEEPEFSIKERLEFARPEFKP